MQQIFFHSADRKLSIARKNKLKDVVAVIFHKEKVLLDRLDYIFCSDDYLLNINKRFLSHSNYTDIITFDLSDSAKTKGEIYVSIDRVKDNAVVLGNIFYEELARVIFHGALHLCGYKDKKKEEIVVMRQKESYYLKMLREL
ncbi:MAG: rRNA maturation RNase YbeY [Panacibacter sp.]